MKNFINFRTGFARFHYDEKADGTGGQQQQQQQQQQPAAAWHAGKVDAETNGYMQNRGWDGKTAEEVALAAMTAHREAEKFLGVPANQLVRLPKDAADEAGWKAVHQRLGAPTDAKDYDFSGAKNAKGEPLDAKTMEMLRGFAGATGMSKDNASRLASEIVKHNDATVAEKEAQRQVVIAQQKADLQKNWGPNAAANMLVAKNAAEALGVPKAAIDALEAMEGVGYPLVMEMFRNIGARIGEAKFVNGEGEKKDTVMSVDAAKSKKAELMRDTEWTKRYMAGDSAAVREMTGLNTIIANADTTPNSVTF